MFFRYCDIFFDKTAKLLSKCWSKDDIVLQYYDKNHPNKGMGLLDDTPMPIVLVITKTKNGLVFEQTEYTRKFLSVS